MTVIRKAKGVHGHLTAPSPRRRSTEREEKEQRSTAVKCVRRRLRVREFCSLKHKNVIQNTFKSWDDMASLKEQWFENVCPLYQARLHNPKHTLLSASQAESTVASAYVATSVPSDLL